jgi:hypothetical protein
MSSNEMSRVTRSKAIAKASYDRMSRWYDLIAGSSERRFVEVGLRQLDARWLWRNRLEKRVGCMALIYQRGCTTSPVRGLRRQGYQREWI